MAHRTFREARIFQDLYPAERITGNIRPIAPRGTNTTDTETAS